MKDCANPRKLYVQVCLFCNMNPPCAHCCYECSPQRKEFMSKETFLAALDREPDAFLNIGGGEPTCHPDFWWMMHQALSAGRRIWISTNGRRKAHALRLAQMAADGTIRARVSIDRFHQPPSPEVAKAFNGLLDQARYRMSFPVRAGRWKDEPSGRDACSMCNGVFVQWDGKVRQCGCLEAPVIGDVYSGYEPMFDGDKAWGCAFGLPDPNGG